MLLELFYLGTANLGASLPENDTVSATGTAAAVLRGNTRSKNRVGTNAVIAADNTVPNTR